MQTATREFLYPKNHKDFEFGWISPEGDSYTTKYEEHSEAAYHICVELGLDRYNPERTLEESGWIKVTGFYSRGVFKQRVFSENFKITKKQADKLFDLGLWEIDYVPDMLLNSQDNW